MSDVSLAALLGGLLAGLAAGTVVAIPPVVVNKDVAGTYLLLIVINILLGCILGVLLFQVPR